MCIATLFPRIKPRLIISSYYGDEGQVYPLGSDSHVIGLCTGLLAAAAVSSSRTVGELIPVAIEVVVTALRLGLCALKVRDLVGQYEAQSQSWSAVISGLHEDQALVAIREFSKRKVSLASLLRQKAAYLTSAGSLPFITAVHQCGQFAQPDDQRAATDSRGIHRVSITTRRQAF